MLFELPLADIVLEFLEPILEKTATMFGFVLFDRLPIAFQLNNFDSIFDQPIIIDDILLTVQLKLHFAARLRFASPSRLSFEILGIALDFLTLNLLLIHFLQDLLFLVYVHSELGGKNTPLLTSMLSSGLLHPQGS